MMAGYTAVYPFRLKRSQHALRRAGVGGWVSYLSISVGTLKLTGIGDKPSLRCRTQKNGTSQFSSTLVPRQDPRQGHPSDRTAQHTVIVAKARDRSGLGHTTHLCPALLIGLDPQPFHPQGTSSQVRRLRRPEPVDRVRRRIRPTFCHRRCCCCCCCCCCCRCCCCCF